MPRLARKNLTTPFLHVMVQGVNKEFVFDDDHCIESYMKIMQEFYPNYGLEFLAYCIMSNHSHFAIYTEDVKQLSEYMYKINSKYARMYNKEHNRCGVLFRNRFQVEPIYSQKHLANCINYIHQNPVKANMVSKCEDYKYSSYNDYKMNKGVAKSEILKKLFGVNSDYLKIFEKDGGKMFMDIEKPSFIEVKEYILNGIKEFKEINNKKLQDILSERETLKYLIKYLKNECGISYVNLRKFFEISYGIMDKLKI